MGFMGDAVLRVAAADDQGRDAVAGLPAGDAGTAGDDFAGHFEAGNIGGALGRRIEAETLHDVGAVHAGGDDFHQDLAFPGRGNRPLLRHQHLRAPWSGDHDGGHARGNGSHHGSLWLLLDLKINTRLFTPCSRKRADFSGRIGRPAQPVRHPAGCDNRPRPPV